MKLKWFFYFIKKSISVSRSRLAVALLALIIGTLLATTLAAISLGIEAKFSRELKAYGANLLLLPKKADRGFLSEVSENRELNFYLSEKEVSLILKDYSEEIENFSPTLYSQAQVKDKNVLLVGVHFNKIRGSARWWQLTGRWPKNLNEALVGAKLKNILAVKNKDVIEIAFGKQKLTTKIVGTVETGSVEERGLYLPIQSVQKLLNQPGQINVVFIRANTDKRSLQQIANQLAIAIPGAKIKTIRQIAEAEEVLLRKIKLLMLMVTIVSLLAATISVMTTMSATILERRTEIGLFKALGGTKITIGLFFLTEAIVIGLVAAIIGFLLGIFSAEVVAKAVFGSFTPLTPALILIALGTALGIATLGSIFPVKSALDVQAAVSLKGE
jgi:putative ABC transport system permease protein